LSDYIEHRFNKATADPEVWWSSPCGDITSSAYLAGRISVRFVERLG